MTGVFETQATRKPDAIKRFSGALQPCVGAIPTKLADSVDSEIVHERLGHRSVAPIENWRDLLREYTEALDAI